MSGATKNKSRERLGKYEIIHSIDTNKPGGRPAIILAAVDVSNPMRYQVRHQSSTIQFATYHEAQDYCRRLGWKR